MFNDLSKNERAGIWGNEEFRVEVNKNINPYGDTNYRDAVIRLNPKRGDLINTIIHENLHAARPDMEHEDVYKNASKIESKMGIPQMIGLLAETQRRVMSAPPKPMEMQYTTASKVVSQTIKHGRV